MICFVSVEDMTDLISCVYDIIMPAKKTFLNISTIVAITLLRNWPDV